MALSGGGGSLRCRNLKISRHGKDICDIRKPPSEHGHQDSPRAPAASPAAVSVIGNICGYPEITSNQVCRSPEHGHRDSHRALAAVPAAMPVIGNICGYPEIPSNNEYRRPEHGHRDSNRTPATESALMSVIGEISGKSEISTAL